jgi:hypothetical protein
VLPALVLLLLPALRGGVLRLRNVGTFRRHWLSSPFLLYYAFVLRKYAEKETFKAAQSMPVCGGTLANLEIEAHLL